MGKTGKMLNLDSLKLDKDKWPVKWYLPFLLAIPLIGATVSISFGSTPIFDDPRHTELRNRALNDDGESQYRLGFLYKEGGFPRISAKNDNEYWEGTGYNSDLPGAAAANSSDQAPIENRSRVDEQRNGYRDNDD